MEMSSTRISDLPENITMQPYGGGGGGGVSDRGIDMASASYRQMNPHQNPYMQGQGMTAMPPPAFKQGGRDVYGSGRSQEGGGMTTQMARPPQPIPPSYDFEQGPLGNSPQFPLPPKDIPIDTSGFRDETARPNYVPSANDMQNFVLEQEDRLREQKHTEAITRAMNKQFDLIAELQMPLIVGILFWIFQLEIWNRLFAQYLSGLSLFGDNGNINTNGLLLKSILFGAAYYGVKTAMAQIE